MPTDLCEAGDCWKMVPDEQSMIRGKGMKSLTSGLARVDAVRLPGWGPRDPRRMAGNTWFSSILQSAEFLHSKSFFLFLGFQDTFTFYNPVLLVLVLLLIDGIEAAGKTRECWRKVDGCITWSEGVPVVPQSPMVVSTDSSYSEAKRWRHQLVVELLSSVN